MVDFFVIVSNNRIFIKPFGYFCRSNFGSFFKNGKKCLKNLIHMGKVMDWYTISSERSFEIEVPPKLTDRKILQLHAVWGRFQRQNLHRDIIHGTTYFRRTWARRVGWKKKLRYQTCWLILAKANFVISNIYEAIAKNDLTFVFAIGFTVPSCGLGASNAIK